MRRALPYAVILAAGFFLALPAVWSGFPARTHDGGYHAMWSRQFGEQFWSGEAYPRWLVNLNGGLGSPTFFYYPPTPYWITAGMQWASGPVDSPEWNALGHAAAFGLILSGLFAFLWLRDVTPTWPAVVGSLAYMVTPYHLVIDLYTRGAFAEFWGVTWLPLVMRGVHRLVARTGINATPFDNSQFEMIPGRLRWQAAAPLLALACAYALLVTSHLPTTLLFSILPLAYSCLVAARGRKVAAVLWTAAGMTLGAGLAGAFLVPALTMQNAVSMEELTRHLYYEHSFFFSGFHSPSYSRFETFTATLFGLVVWTLGAIGGALCMLGSQAPGPMRRQAAFWAVVTLACVFMMVPLSNPVWRLFPIVQVVQFPWRFNTVLCVAAAAALGLGATAIQRGASWRTIVSALVAWVFVGIWFYYTIDAVAAHWRQTKPAQHLLLRDAPEYRPRNAASTLEAALSPFGGSGSPAPAVFVIKTSGTITLDTWKPRDIRLHADAASNTTLLIRQYYFPGWTAQIDGIPQEVRASNPEGLISLDLPPGRHRVCLKLEQTSAECAGWLTTILSGGISILLLIAACRSGLRREPAGEFRV